MAMATIEPYQTKAGKRYRVRYRTPGRGQTDKRGFKTKREAEAFAAIVEVAKMRGEYIAPSAARVTVGELGPVWLDRQRGHLKPSGYGPMETAWRLRIEPRWGHVALGDIRPTAVQQWISELGRGTPETKPVGAAVVKRTHYVISGILTDAVRDNLIAKNPAAGMKLPRTTRKRPVYLTHQHVGALAAAAGEYEGLVLLLAYTGLRWVKRSACASAISTCCAGGHRSRRMPFSRARRYTLALPRRTNSASCRCRNSC
jgi:hypothetical protein